MEKHESQEVTRVLGKQVAVELSEEQLRVVSAGDHGGGFPVLEAGFTCDGVVTCFSGGADCSGSAGNDRPEM
jgi:hypothetical protein